ncbi:ralBP1-associated Eps domain-containing protein 2 [Vanacampus margaritifer]
MEPEGGGGAVSAAVCAGGVIPLHEHEQRYYSGLHGLCQADPSGKQLSSSKVAELFKASQLPADVLHKVTEVCGAKRAGYFGTTHFYVALKLLAAAQAGLPVHLQSTSTNLPLPRFVGITTDPEMRYIANVPGAIEAQCDRVRCLDLGAEQKEPPPPLPGSSPPRSPLAYRTYQYSTPKERQMADSYMERGCQQECDDDDPWRITEEQREYYTNQFKSLQPDLGALILGAVAKNFFTKSKLPIPELSHIWQLSDVDRDGALTFPEFCAAFHLIVARKNGYPLPESLPPGLHPGSGPPDEDVPPQHSQFLIALEDGATGFRQTDQSIKLPTSATKAKQGSKEEASKKQECSFRGVETLKEGATLQFATFSHRPEPSSRDLDPHSKMKTRPRSYSSTSIDDAIRKAEEPPTPPPRPQKKSHSRASSLDLNKLFQQGAPGLMSGWLPPPPALPPRPSALQVASAKVQQPNFADFSRFTKEEESGEKAKELSLRSAYHQSTEDVSNSSQQGPTHNQAPQKPVRRKFRPDSQNVECLAPSTGSFLKATQKTLSGQKREIQMAIRKNKESHAVLTRLNSELQQQLKVVHHQRVTLETQLDLLRPVAST